MTCTYVGLEWVCSLAEEESSRVIRQLPSNLGQMFYEGRGLCSQSIAVNTRKFVCQGPRPELVAVFSLVELFAGV